MRFRSSDLNEPKSLVETPCRVHVKGSENDRRLPVGCSSLDRTKNRGADTLALPIGVNDDLPHMNVGGTLLYDEVSTRRLVSKQDLSCVRIPCCGEEAILFGLVPLAELLHHNLSVGRVVDGSSEFPIIRRGLPPGDPHLRG